MSDGTTDSASTDHHFFSALVDGYLEGEARADFDTDQVAILERARDTHEISFEDYARAISASLDCVASAGYHVERFEPTDERSFPTIGYFVESPATDESATMTCITRHSAAVEALYQVQPSSVQAEERVLGERVAAFSACLESVGIEAPLPGLPPDEARQEVLRLMDSEPLTDPDAPGPVHSCALDAGL